MAFVVDPNPREGKLATLKRWLAVAAPPSSGIDSIPTSLRLQTHAGVAGTNTAYGNAIYAPVGLYTDTGATVPALEPGDAVAAWKDVLGDSGLVATQSDSGKRPTLQFAAADAHGKRAPYLQFDGIDDELDIADAIDAFWYQCAAVGKPSGSSIFQAIGTGSKRLIAFGYSYPTVSTLYWGDAGDAQFPFDWTRINGVLNWLPPSGNSVITRRGRSSDALTSLNIGGSTGFGNFGGDLTSIILVSGDDYSDADKVEKYTARLAGVTLGGRAIQPLFTQETGAIGGQTYYLLTPVGTPNDTLIVRCHGSGQTSGGITLDTAGTTPAWRQHTLRCLDGGYTVAASDAHGESWGNSDAVADLVALVAHARAVNPALTKIIFSGHSMGGVVSINSIVNGGISGIVGWKGTDPVQSLLSLYNHGYTGVYPAYGVASDGSDFSSKTAGYDPIHDSASAFNGLHMRWYASPDDTAVDKGENTDTMYTLVTSGSPAEANVVTYTGPHGAEVHFMLLDDMMDFLTRARS